MPNGHIENKLTRLEQKHVHARYIDVIKDMHDGMVTNVRIIGGETNTSSITIALHQK